MAKKQITEAMITDMMKRSKCSREDAIEMIKYDMETDAMSMSELMAELTPEEKEARKAATKVGRKPGTKNTKPRKEDPVKRAMVAMVEAMLKEAGYTDIVVSNPEKMVDFMFEGESYSLSLIKHRKAKE